MPKHSGLIFLFLPIKGKDKQQDVDKRPAYKGKHMMLGGSTFWAPVGITIFAGGIGSLILVVTILPVLYSKIYK